MSDGENLEKLAQEKLSQAWKLIEEAGELAKRGQFFLHFGEVGSFIPRSLMDRDLARLRALEELKAEGRDNGYDKVVNTELSAQRGYEVYDYVNRLRTPYDQLTPAEVEVAVDDIVEGMMEDSEVPWEFREYHSADDADTWWHPSRC